MRRKAYMCKTSFDHDLGNAPKVLLYNSQQTLEDNTSCHHECGIVEVEVILKRVVREPQPATIMKGGNKSNAGTF